MNLLLASLSKQIVLITRPNLPYKPRFESRVRVHAQYMLLVTVFQHMFILNLRQRIYAEVPQTHYTHLIVNILYLL